MRHSLPTPCAVLFTAVTFICFFASSASAQFNSTNVGGFENLLGTSAANAANLAGALNTNNSINGTIAGAANSSLSDLWIGFIGGSYLGNIGSGSHVSAILGGHANTISANSSRAAILGGFANTASAEMATVVGGALNNNRAINGTIAGSSDSSMADLWVGFIGGSYLGNIGSGSHVSAIVGGHGNSISANSWRAVVLGGFSNTVSSVSAMVGGGENNMISPNAFASFIGAGTYNTASAPGASVVGGFANEAAGTNSFAAGTRAVASHDYSFVWGGSPDTDTTSFGNGTFTVRAPGGAKFLTSVADGIGAQLVPSGASWTTLSDSNVKTRVTAIDHRQTLAKLAALPVTEWSYKHDTKRRYIGPMAQDFRAAFGLGYDDKHISTIDTDGVTMSAIKGLVEELQEQDNALDAREAQIRKLESAVQELREHLGENRL
jgi:hypothetical protein